MATDIVGSLFGVTPELLQQRQFEMADRQAQEYAQMSPLQRASYGLARGGYQLAGALGGEDPQLRMVSTRNAIARQIDPTDPQSMMRGIQALQQAGDQVGAMQLAAVYQQRMKVLADIGQSEAAAASSRATTGKTLAETSELEARAAARAASARRYFGGAAGQTEATAQPAAAVEAAPAPYFNESVIADLPARVQDDIRTVLGDAAQLRNIPEDELRSARATARLKTADALDRQAASILAATQRSARGFTTPAETQEVDSALALLRPPQALPVTRDAPTAPAAAAAAPARAAASEDRITAIQRRLDTILPDRDAGLKAAEIEGKQLEEELKFLREAAKPTEIERLIARREQLIAGGAQPESSALQAISGRIANLQGREVRFGEQREAYASDQFGKPFAQLTQAQQKIINDRVDEESQKRKPSITNVMPRQEAGVNKNKVELAGQVEANAINATDRVTLARNLRSFLPQAFTGLGSDVKLEASRFAAALGIPVTGTTESQIIDQILGQMTIGAAGQLKGALSDKDREFLKQTIGTRGLTRSALEFVSQRIEREARVDERLNEAVQAWQKSGKSLNDFNFATQRSEAARQIDADIKRLEELRRKQRGG